MFPAVVQDPHLGEGDVYYGDGGPDGVYGADGALWGDGGGPCRGPLEALPLGTCGW